MKLPSGSTYTPSTSETYDGAEKALGKLQTQETPPKEFFDLLKSQKSQSLVKSGASKESRSNRTQLSYQHKGEGWLFYMCCRRGRTVNFPTRSHWDVNLPPYLVNFGFVESEEPKDAS